MYGYGLEPDFWLRLIILLAIVSLLCFFFNTIVSRWLNVERSKFFSKNYVNEKHKKIDWIIRIATIVSLFSGYAINITRDPHDSSNWYWFLQPWFILFIFIIVSQISRAVMEWKYAQNPNAYKLTISEIVFILILCFTIFKTDVWGLA